MVAKIKNKLKPKKINLFDATGKSIGECIININSKGQSFSDCQILIISAINVKFNVDQDKRGNPECISQLEYFLAGKGSRRVSIEKTNTVVPFDKFTANTVVNVKINDAAIVKAIETRSSTPPGGMPIPKPSTEDSSEVNSTEVKSAVIFPVPIASAVPILQAIASSSPLLVSDKKNIDMQILDEKSLKSASISVNLTVLPLPAHIDEKQNSESDCLVKWEISKTVHDQKQLEILYLLDSSGSMKDHEKGLAVVVKLLIKQHDEQSCDDGITRVHTVVSYGNSVKVWSKRESAATAMASVDHIIFEGHTTLYKSISMLPELISSEGIVYYFGDGDNRISQFVPVAGESIDAKKTDYYMKVEAEGVQDEYKKIVSPINLNSIDQTIYQQTFTETGASELNQTLKTVRAAYSGVLPRINSISIGGHHAPGDFQRLAVESGGNYFFAESSHGVFRLIQSLADVATPADFLSDLKINFGNSSRALPSFYAGAKKTMGVMRVPLQEAQVIFKNNSSLSLTLQAGEAKSKAELKISSEKCSVKDYDFATDIIGFYTELMAIVYQKKEINDQDHRALEQLLLRIPADLSFGELKKLIVYGIELKERPKGNALTSRIALIYSIAQLASVNPVGNAGVVEDVGVVARGFVSSGAASRFQSAVTNSIRSKMKTPLFVNEVDDLLFPKFSDYTIKSVEDVDNKHIRFILYNEERVEAAIHALKLRFKNIKILADRAVITVSSDLELGFIRAFMDHSCCNDDGFPLHAILKKRPKIQATVLTPIASSNPKDCIDKKSEQAVNLRLQLAVKYSSDPVLFAHCYAVMPRSKMADFKSWQEQAAVGMQEQFLFDDKIDLTQIKKLNVFFGNNPQEAPTIMAPHTDAKSIDLAKFSINTRAVLELGSSLTSNILLRLKPLQINLLDEKGNKIGQCSILKTAKDVCFSEWRILIIDALNSMLKMNQSADSVSELKFYLTGKQLTDQSIVRDLDAVVPSSKFTQVTYVEVEIKNAELVKKISQLQSAQADGKADSRFFSESLSGFFQPAFKSARFVDSDRFVSHFRKEFKDGTSFDKIIPYLIKQNLVSWEESQGPSDRVLHCRDQESAQIVDKLFSQLDFSSCNAPRIKRSNVLMLNLNSEMQSRACFSINNYLGWYHFPFKKIIPQESKVIRP